MDDLINKSIIIEELKRQEEIDADYGSNVYDVCEDLISFIEDAKINLWKSAEGDDLPDYDRKVIVIRSYHNDPFVCTSSRVKPAGYLVLDKSVSEEKTLIHPNVYGKGGWKSPGVVLWLDLEIPDVKDENN